ncbi:MAG: TIGR04438 family Trp-rich protein [Gemmatimonadota bacterium]
MWLLIFAFLLLALKLIGFPPQMEAVSWWWVAAPFALAFVWFEFIERTLGLDKRKAFDELRRTKETRIKEALERTKQFRRR